VALYERFTGVEGFEPQLKPHIFAAALGELARGEITRAQLTAAFFLTASDEADLDLMQGHYAGLTSSEKLEYLTKVRDVLILANEGLYTKAKAAASLGF
jgi:hypothetical protein